MNKEWFINKGYTYTGYRHSLKVKSSDLQPSSSVKVDVFCDNCKKEYVTSYDCYYQNTLIHHGKNYCKTCVANFSEKNKYNKIYYTHPKIAKLLKNELDAYNYNINTYEKLEFVCEYCNCEYKAIPLSLKHAKSNLCPCCSDSFSYNNKFIYNILNQLPLDFNQEYYDKNWCKTIINRKEKKMIYDFEFSYNGTKYIIEADGGFHYKDTNLSKLNDVKLNDKLKEDLAIKNGYILIRIDCYNCKYDNTGEFIKQQFIDKFNNIFDLTIINWDICFKNALKSDYIKVFDLYSHGLTPAKIAKEIKRSRSFVDTIIKRGKNANILSGCTQFELFRINQNKIKDFWDSGVFDLNYIANKLGYTDASSIRRALDELYEETKDLYYKLCRSKYYFCKSNNSYYSSNALIEFLKLNKTSENVYMNIWRSINRKTKSYGYLWDIVSRQEAYFYARKNNLLLVE